MGKTYIADKETLDKCYAILSADGIYGFIEHMDVLSPTARIEYIGQNKDFTPISLNKDTGTMTLNSWADFPIIVANKPWMVRADGTPDYRLDENDYTKKEDGTASDVSNTSYNGGAFSWLAKIYKQEYMLGNDRFRCFTVQSSEQIPPHQRWCLWQDCSLATITPRTKSIPQSQTSQAVQHSSVAELFRQSLTF